MKVYLRAFELDDYKISTKWRNNRDITNSLGGNYFFVSSEREKKWIENSINNDKNNIRLAICLKENNEYIGNVNLININWINRNAEFSIFIGEKKDWGKGYATESTKLMLNFGFNQRNLHRIYLTVLENNKVAIHIYEKLGPDEMHKVLHEFLEKYKYEMVCSLPSSHGDFTCDNDCRIDEAYTAGQKSRQAEIDALKEVLDFYYQRLIKMHDENKNYDYMIKGRTLLEKYK